MISITVKTIDSNNYEFSVEENVCQLTKRLIYYCFDN
jgi:hypothetical protein